MINWKQTFGIVTTVAVIGLTVYSIKKYYDSKKQDEQSIGLDEAKRIVEDEAPSEEYHGVDNTIVGPEGELHYDPDMRQSPDRVKFRFTEDEMENVRFGARDEAHYDPKDGSTGVDILEVREDAAAEAHGRKIGLTPEELAEAQEEEEEEAQAFYETDDPQEVQDSRGYFEEDKDVIDDLRYEPNSVEAREQFINMELANLGRDNDTRDVVAMLYDQPFVPTCDEDHNLKSRLIDHRIKFFGLVSRWTKEVSFGDLIMYYGKAAEFNCGEDVRHWVDYFLSCADMNNITLTSDEFDERIRFLNTHNFYNEDLNSFGLFGLTHAQFDEAIIIAGQRIDEKVTYDIEFHQFIQGIVERR